MLQRHLFNPLQSDFIKNIPLFSGLSENEIAGITKDAHFCSCPKKQTLFRQGDPVTHFYVLCNGTARLFHVTPEGHEITTDIRSKNDTLGAMGMLSHTGIHHSNAEAVDNVMALEFRREDFTRHIKTATFSRNLLFDMSGKIGLRKLEAEQHVTMTAPQIVACFLQRLCAAGNYNSLEFDLPYSKSLIAMKLGMQRETFSRALSRQKEMGITVKGNHVSIYDAKKLEAHSCMECSYQDSCLAFNLFHKKGMNS